MNYPNHTPPKAKKKTNPPLIVAIIGFVVTLAACCGVAALANSSGEKKPAAAVTTQAVACGHGTLPNGSCAEAADPKTTVITNTVQPTAVAPTTPAAAKVPTITDGTWTVGEDIPAGTYKTIGAGSTCYWSITKSGTNGADIIDNHIGGGNLRVTVKAGQDFETDRCGTWQKV